MWIQLRGIKHIEVQGRLRTYHAGDWVDVGKQTARQWLAQGDAWIPEGRAGKLVDDDCGVLVVRGGVQEAKRTFEPYLKTMQIEHGVTLRLPWEKTVIYDPSLRLRRELVPVGLSLLDVWQVAAPLCDYDTLAQDLGTEEERAYTKEIVRDLRVPVYSRRLLFVRRSSDTKRLVETWAAEMEKGDDERLALLRAIYLTKPLVLALPCSWCGVMDGL